MRGIPILEMLFIAVLFGFAAVPLSRLTSDDARGASDAPPQAETGFSGSFVVAKFAHLPIFVSVAGEEMEAPDFEIDIETPQGDALAISVKWAADTPATAVTFVVETEAQPAAEHTFWSDAGSPTLDASIPLR